MTKRERQPAKQTDSSEPQKKDPGASIDVLVVWDPIIVCGGGTEFRIVDHPSHISNSIETSKKCEHENQHLAPNIPAIVVIEFDDGYVAAALNGCVTLTPDAAKAIIFISEAEALDFIVEKAPSVLAWAGCVKFCRCTSSSFFRALSRHSSPRESARPFS